MGTRRGLSRFPSGQAVLIVVEILPVKSKPSQQPPASQRRVPTRAAAKGSLEGAAPRGEAGLSKLGFLFTTS